MAAIAVVATAVVAMMDAVVLFGSSFSFAAAVAMVLVAEITSAAKQSKHKMRPDPFRIGSYFV